MQKEISIKRLISYLIFACALISMLCIWPFGLVRREVVNESHRTTYDRTGQIVEGGAIIQEFVPQYDYLESISLYLSKGWGQASEGEFSFQLYNENLEVIDSFTQDIALVEEETYYDIKIEQSVEAGKTYYYRIDCSNYGDMAPSLYLAQGPIENVRIYYGAGVMEGFQAANRYIYGAKLIWHQVLVYDIFILLMALMLIELAGFILGKTGNNKKITISTAVNTAFSGVTLLGFLYLFQKIVMQNLFAAQRVDRIVYCIGLLTALFALLYAIWHIHIKKPLWKQSAQVYIGYIRTVFFACCLLACCYYVNAKSNYFQYLAMRYVIIAFGLAILTWYTKERLIRKSNLLAVFSAIGYIGYGMTRGLSEQDMYLWQMTAVAILIWGIIVINTIWNMKNKEREVLSIPYGLCYMILAELLMFFSNGFSWPFFAVFAFTLFYAQKFDQKQHAELFTSLSHGIMLSFYVMTALALLYRPWHNWRFTRYPGMFQSVAVAGLYLTLVVCAAIIILYAAYVKKRSVSAVWKELFQFGIVMSFVYFTVSRTALLTVFIVIFVGVLLTGSTVFRDNIRSIVGKLCMLFLTSIIFVPMMFLIIRGVPASIQRPYMFEGEWFWGVITPETAVDSELHITLRRFLAEYSEKINYFFEDEETEGDANKDAQGQFEQVIYIEETGKQFEQIASVQETATLIELAEAGGEEDMTQADMAAQGSDDSDITNGRLYRYIEYIKDLNFTGHDTMYVEYEDGSRIGHAHNSFLQVAHDQGIIAGIVFIIFFVWSCLRALRYFFKGRTLTAYTILPGIMLLGFAIASMTEWLMHPCHPFGFVFFIVLHPLLKGAAD